MIPERLVLISRSSTTISSKCTFCLAQSRCLNQKNWECQIESAAGFGTNTLLGRQYRADEWTNVTAKIISKLDKHLLRKVNHPICIVKQRIINYFHQKYGGYAGSSSPLFSAYEDFPATVTKRQNFDDLLIPEDHIARSKSDNYFINKVNNVCSIPWRNV